MYSKEILNINVVAQALKDLGISVKVNEFTQKMEFRNIPSDNPYVLDKFHKLPEAEKNIVAVDLLSGILKPYLQDRNCSVSLYMLRGYINTIADIYAYNPVEDILKSQEWDGLDRIAELYKIMDIADNELYCRLLKKWLIQAVAMALNDEGLRGCDFALILQGEQSVTQTEFFRNIAIRPEWFLGSAYINMRGKNSVINALSHWIVEIDDIQTMMKHSKFKSFITASTLKHRSGRIFKEYARHTVFYSTLNQKQFSKYANKSRLCAIIRTNNIDSKKMCSLSHEWYIQMWIQAYNLFLQDKESYRLSDKEYGQQD